MNSCCVRLSLINIVPIRSYERRCWDSYYSFCTIILLFINIWLIVTRVIKNGTFARFIHLVSYRFLYSYIVRFKIIYAIITVCFFNTLINQELSTLAEWVFQTCILYFFRYFINYLVTRSDHNKSKVLYHIILYIVIYSVSFHT